MEYIKELLKDFKYLNRQKKVQVCVIIAAFVLGIGGLLFFVNKLRNGSDTDIKADLNDYIAYSYQDNGEINVVNLNKNQSLSKTKVNNISSLLLENRDSLDNYLHNPFKLLSANDKIYALDFKGSIVEYAYDKSKVTELKRISVNSSPVDFKIYDSSAYVSYLNSNIIDVVDLSSGSKTKTFKTNSSITSFELVDDSLYTGTKEGVEIINVSNPSKKNIVKIDEDCVSTEIFVSEFKESPKPKKVITASSGSDSDSNSGNIAVTIPTAKDKEDKEDTGLSAESDKVKTVYILNTFASDNKNSVLLKFQEGKPVDLTPLKKENPISIVESQKLLYITCRGLSDSNGKDSLVIVNKGSFKVNNTIELSDKPNATYMLDKDFVYISHDNGDIVKVNLRDESVDTSFSVPNIKGLVVQKYKK